MEDDDHDGDSVTKALVNDALEELKQKKKSKQKQHQQKVETGEDLEGTGLFPCMPGAQCLAMLFDHGHLPPMSLQPAKERPSLRLSGRRLVGRCEKRRWAWPTQNVPSKGRVKVRMHVRTIFWRCIAPHMTQGSTQ